MKTAIISAGIGLLAILATSCVTRNTYHEQARIWPAPALGGEDQLTVSGTATVFARPDKVKVGFSIVHIENDLARAKDHNDKVYNKTFAYLRNEGFTDDDIKTDNMEIRYDQVRRNNDYVDQYTVTTRFEVMVRDLERSNVNDLVTGIVNQGVKQVDGLTFETTDYRDYRRKAREAAVQAAKDKAAEFAAVMGRSAGDVIRVQDINNGNPWYGGGSNRMMNSQIQISPYSAGGGGGTTNEIALGEISFQASATLVFELED